VKKETQRDTRLFEEGTESHSTKGSRRDFADGLSVFDGCGEHDSERKLKFDIRIIYRITGFSIIPTKYFP
jgi:hypothetical protein